MLTPCAIGTAARHACYRACPGAARPGGTGIAMTPQKGTRGSREGSLPSRTRLPRAERFVISPTMNLHHGPSEGGSGLPDGAGVPWLLDSCSAILTKVAQNKKTVRQQRSACAHHSRSECQLRPVCRSSTVRARHRQCTCARRDQTCTLRLLRMCGVT